MASTRTITRRPAAAKTQTTLTRPSRVQKLGTAPATSTTTTTITTTSTSAGQVLVTTVVPTTTSSQSPSLSAATPIPTTPTQDMRRQLSRIAHSTRTPFEKRVYSALCQIPPGRFTTYGVLAAHLSSSPRAVGNALRRNPFAPEVPCHRVVAAGGAIGGFKGHWVKGVDEAGGALGETLDEKVGLLREEGVRLAPDGRKAMGTPFDGFV